MLLSMQSNNMSILVYFIKNNSSLKLKPKTLEKEASLSISSVNKCPPKYTMTQLRNAKFFQSCAIIE